MMEIESVWLDGTIVSYQDAQTSVFAHALHYGGAVYEGVRVYGGIPFMLDSHLNRLERSARILGFEIPFSLDTIKTNLLEYLNTVAPTESYVRLLVWRGAGMGVGGRSSEVHLAFAAWRWKIGSAEREGGISLKTSRWRRPAPNMAPTEAKTSSLYTIGTLAAREAHDAGADDALLLSHRGDLADITGANIFFVKNHVLLTPVADSFLGGITRDLILSEAGLLGYEVEVRHIKPAEVDTFDEMFACGTAYEIQPVRSVDGSLFGSNSVGKQLSDWYQRRVRP